MGTLAEVLSFDAHKRTKKLNSVQSSTKHNEDMIASAAKQSNTPVKDAAAAVKESAIKAAQTGPNILKFVARTGVNTTSNAVKITAGTTIGLTSFGIRSAISAASIPLSVATNIFQLPFEVTKLGSRVAIVTTDTVTKVAGYPSQLVKKGADALQSGVNTAENKVISLAQKVEEKANNAIEKIPGTTKTKKAA